MAQGTDDGMTVTGTNDRVIVKRDTVNVKRNGVEFDTELKEENL